MLQDSGSVDDMLVSSIKVIFIIVGQAKLRVLDKTKEATKSPERVATKKPSKPKPEQQQSIVW